MVTPPVHCPAVYVPTVQLATAEELAPIIEHLSTTTEPSSQAFVKGTLQRDGRLDFCKQGLGPDGLRAVLRPLGKGQARARHLLLGTNGLGDEGAAVLGDALEHGFQVQTLYLGCNLIGSEGVAALARGISHQGSVRALWLKRNPIGERGLSTLLHALPQTSLRTLDLTNCALGDEGACRVVEVLHQTCSPLRYLFLGANGLLDGRPLAAWLADPSCQLEGLFLGASRLGEAGAEQLFEALSVNRSLRTIDLSSNAIGRLARLAKWLPNSSLAWLALGQSPAAEKLGVAHNHFGSRDARTMLDAAAQITNPPTVLFGPGIARTLRRRGKGLTEAPTIPEDIRAIASVYR